MNSNYPLIIKFHDYYYDICLEKEDNMIENIIKNLITNKTYEIQFQNKQYSLNSK